MKKIICFALALLSAGIAAGQEYSAGQLIAALKAGAPEGGVYARLRMEHKTAAGSQVLQVQVKRRPAPGGGTDQLYQVLFPKERKGEGILLHVEDNHFSGATFVPGQGVRKLGAGDGGTAVFGTALTIDHLRASFLNWSHHEITGTEKIGNAPCSIVESQPAEGAAGRTCVRSWIDTARLVSMKEEFFVGGSGKVLSDVATHKVNRSSSTGRYVPSAFTITDHQSGAATKVEGVRSDSGLTYTDADFTEAALETVTGAPGK